MNALPLGSMLLTGAAATAGLLPYVIEQLSTPSQDVSLEATRRKELGISDYGVYEQIVEPDLILTSYGALGAIYEVAYDDTAGMTDGDRIRHCAWLNDALHKLGNLTNSVNGWMIQSYAIRSEAPPQAAPESGVSDGRRVLAESRIEHLAGMRTVVRHLLAVVYLPSSEKHKAVQQLVFTGEAPVEASFDKVRSDYRRGLEAIEDSLRRVARLRRLGEHPKDRTRNELLEAIFQVAYDEEQPIVVGYPFEPSAIGGLLAARDISPAGVYPKVGEKHVRVLGIFGYPAQTNPAMLDEFLRVAGKGCRLATRAVFQDPQIAAKKLEQKRGMAAGGKFSLLQLAMGSLAGPVRVNRLAAMQEERVDDALLASATSQISWTHFQAKAVLFAEDEATLAESVRRVRRSLQRAGFTVNLETINTLEAYFGHLPFDGLHDPREGPVHTGNVSRIWASSSRWGGRSTWACKACGPITVPALVGLTDSGEDFAFDPHDEDSQSFAAYGAPGTGKTTWLNALAGGYLRTATDRFFAIDKNFGQLVTCKFLGGDYRESSRYWLFDDLHNPAKRAFLVEFIALLCKLNRVDLEDRDLLQTTLEQMLEDAAELRSLSTFVGLYEGANGDKRVLQTLRDYTRDGVHNGVFDGAWEPDFARNPYEVHELGDLIGGSENELVAAPVLVWVLRSFEDRIAGCRSLIAIDEAWAALKSPLVAPIIEDLIRTLRYRHSGLGLLTHNIDDVRSSAIGKTVAAACKTKVLFPNPLASGDLREFYERVIELTEAQIQTVKMGTPKRDFSIVTSDGKFGSGSLPLSAAQAAVFGCTGKAERVSAAKLMLDHPDDWRERFIRPHDTRVADRLRSLRLSREMNTPSLIEALN